MAKTPILHQTSNILHFLNLSVDSRFFGVFGVFWFCFGQWGYDLLPFWLSFRCRLSPIWPAGGLLAGACVSWHAPSVLSISFWHPQVFGPIFPPSTCLAPLWPSHLSRETWLLWGGEWGLENKALLKVCTLLWRGLCSWAPWVSRAGV